MTDLLFYDHRFHPGAPIWRVFYQVTDAGRRAPFNVVRLAVVNRTCQVNMPLGILSPDQWATVDNAIAEQIAQAAA